MSRRLSVLVVGHSAPLTVMKHFFSVTRDFEKEKETTHKDDLLVEYLDGPNQGIVVFGLNRPKVKLKLPKTRM